MPNEPSDVLLTAPYALASTYETWPCQRCESRLLSTNISDLYFFSVLTVPITLPAGSRNWKPSGLVMSRLSAESSRFVHSYRVMGWSSPFVTANGRQRASVLTEPMMFRLSR